jgi:hypothetical protein
VRGGAIPILAWGAVLAILGIIGAVWDPRWISATLHFGATAIIVLVGAAIIAVSGWLAVRRGAPPVPARPEAVPESSVAAFGAAVSLGLIGFGFVFGSALIYLGAGLLALSFGRGLAEIRAQRRDLGRGAGEAGP